MWKFHSTTLSSLAITTNRPTVLIYHSSLVEIFNLTEINYKFLMYLYIMAVRKPHPKGCSCGKCIILDIETCRILSQIRVNISN